LDEKSKAAPIVYTEEQLRPKTFWQLNEHTNLFEEIDPVTGAVVSVAGDMQYLARRAEFVETIIDGQKIMVQTGVHYADLSFTKRSTYSEALADVIAQKIAEGTPLTSIPQIPYMPSLNMIRMWMREHRDFADKIREAKKFAAEVLRDRALALGEQAVGMDKNEVPGQALAINTMKWAAEKADPATYGNKVEVSGGVTMELKLETGVRRSGDPGAPVIIVDSKVKISEKPRELENYEVAEPIPENVSEIKEGEDEPSED
jgi:hypothetical protein